MRLASVFLCLGISIAAWATPGPVVVLTTSDDAETPYAWRERICRFNGEQLTVYTKAKEDGMGQVQFILKNFKTKFDALESGKTLSLSFKSTEEFGMTFEDRNGTTYAFQPRRNKVAACDLSVTRDAEGKLKLWGSCKLILPKNPKESFPTDVTIAEANAIECAPVIVN